ncbi:O-antigen ligase family protein [Spirochaetota bacterium]
MQVFYKSTDLICFIALLLFMAVDLTKIKSILTVSKKLVFLFILFIILALTALYMNLDAVKSLDPNTWWRLIYWKKEAGILLNTSFLGVGFGTPYSLPAWEDTIRLIFFKYHGPESHYIVAQHNSFMNILYRTGFIGFLLFIMFNYFIIRSFKKNYIANMHDKSISGSINILFLGYVLSVINILLNVGLESPRVFLSYLLFVPLSVAYLKNIEKHNKTLHINI